MYYGKYSSGTKFTTFENLLFKNRENMKICDLYSLATMGLDYCRKDHLG